MDDHTTPETLEWWANPSVCLGVFPVRVERSTTGTSRRHSAVFAPELSTAEREEFGLLLELDPFFELRTADGAGVWVEVEPWDGVGPLRLVVAHDVPRVDQRP
ncbi:hypothetical protein ACIA8O_02385 [Kitasatospora sp. NPDC051853]|uniref:hypothetical protein n=1 Tax=Kitasatospora sp. NPDC051853 TaxID=3364058 RepID=UPI0037995124